MNFKFKTISMLFAGAAVAMTSCSSDEPVNGGPLNEGEGIGYMAFTISSDGTRADQEIAGNGTPGQNQDIDDEIFNDGHTQEYAICPNSDANLAVFFAGGKLYGITNLTPFNAKDDLNNVDDNHKDNADHADNYPEQFYTYISRWNKTTNQKPDQVLILMNVDPTLKETLKTEISEDDVNAVNKVLAKTAKNSENFGIYKFSGDQYFTMTNSTFFGVGNVNQTTASIDASQVCNTPEEALKNRVTVYVERVLAKFEVKFGATPAPLTDGNALITPKTANGEDVAKINYVANYSGDPADETNPNNLDYPTYVQTAWNIYVNNWGVNAVEPESYYYKQIKNEDYFGTTGWNFPTLHRSYWGESMNYANNEKASFPTQYRPTTYEPGSKDNNWGINWDNNHKGQTDGETALTYYSYNHYNTRAAYKYAPERTYNASMGLNGYGPYRFGSHILIQAQLVVTEVVGVDKDLTAKEGLALKNISDKYYAYNFYFGNVESYIRYAYRRMITKFGDGRTYTIGGNTYTLNKDNATLYTYDAEKDEYAPLKVKDAATYFTTEMAQNIHGDGKVVLKANQDLFYKDPSGKYIKITVNELRNVVYNFAEAASHFKNGKMYYAIPVQHKQGKTAGATVTPTFDGENYAVGQFGTVRNHWYTFTVKSIGNVGTSVDDPDQPIIPDPEDNYNIALEIVVLPWHLIDNGSVDL